MVNFPIQATRWTTRKYGSIDNLSKESYEISSPAEGQAIISVRAIGLNFADVYGSLGLYSPAGDPPYTPGFEISGVIQAIGPNVNKFSVGDKIFGLTKFGGYTTHISINENYIFHLPKGWSFEQGAAYPCQAITAWYGLCNLGGLKKGSCDLLTSKSKRVIIHSAAGGVGLMAIKIMHHLGGEIIATIGNADKIHILKDQGILSKNIIVRGIDDINDGFEKTVRSRINNDNEGIDVILDSVMGTYFQPGYNLLNKGGRYIVIGSASLMPSASLNTWNIGTLLCLGWNYLNRPKLDLLASINQNKSISGFNLGLLFDCIDLLVKGLQELSQMNLSPPLVSRTFPFNDAKDALKLFQKGRSVGKLIIVCDDTASEA